MPRSALVLQHVPNESPGLIEHALRAKGVDLTFVRPYRGDPVPLEPAQAVGLVVMGGPMGVYEADRYPFLRDEMKLIEQALAKGCPVLGVCLGSQLLASVLGAEVRPGARKEIGWHTLTLTEHGLIDPLFKGIESSFAAFHWHGDIFALPAGATSLGRSESTEHQAFRYGASAYGLLFHMEVTSEIAKSMVEAFPEDVRDAGVTVEAIAAGTDQHLASLTERGRRVFAGWADRVAAYGDARG